jgi:transposase-like protein
MVDKVTCPECKSTRVWLKGSVPSRSGPKQRYVCFTCGRTFYKPKAEAKVAKLRATRKVKTSRKKAG